MTRDYKSTVFLPQTSFPMKGGLPEKEPEILKRWQQINLYKQLQEKCEKSEPFVLHDGPPFANGHIHLGTALNKILKDVINRVQTKLGRRVPYVPGWDCHGLPIEAKIVEKYSAQGLNKDQVPVRQFRQDCREFAESWIKIQKEEFKRLGILGDFDSPYSTMTAEAEAEIIQSLHTFLQQGNLYRGVKPVMWSVVEKTALAEAEVEYKDHESLSIYVRFPIVKTPLKSLEGASVVIWTTTPWTLPGNRAVAYQKDSQYVVLQVDEVQDNSLASEGQRFVVAKALKDEFAEKLGIIKNHILNELEGRDLEGAICHHPLREKGYDFDVPLLPGEHVTLETGTGLVHIAPGHGREDFIVGQQFNIETPATVDEGGYFYDFVPFFSGKHIYKVNPEVLHALQESKTLLYQHKLIHSYPHSWRSKTPLIFRTTPQWFIGMEKNQLRDKAIAALKDVTWYPTASVNRIQAMIENRPDWCISRQRTWGIPLAFFVHKTTGEPLLDSRVLGRIVAAVKEHTSDIWYDGNYAEFLSHEYDVNDYEPVLDIVDVWFESGSTQAFVLKKRPELRWPADLYLEGTDQHRGWFQSSLLLGCALNEKAPYKQVFTHGFVVDENGRKMSKSLGNTIEPNEITEEMGADILRLWVVSSDYHDDLRIGPDILKHQQDIYRRYRNTLRYLLGALNGYEAQPSINIENLPELEQWILHRLKELDTKIHTAFKNYELQSIYNEIHNFCTSDLSAFYFDIRKDSLYCDQPQSSQRQATLAVMSLVFDCLVKWLSPVLCFTAEEAWLARYSSETGSVHLETFDILPLDWENEKLSQKWDKVREIRRVLTGALEVARANKVIGSSLQAQLTVYLDKKWQDSIQDINLEELAIVSYASISFEAPSSNVFTLSDVQGVFVDIALAEGQKCGRCWKVLKEVGTKTYSDVCERCDEALIAYDSQ